MTEPIQILAIVVSLALLLLVLDLVRRKKLTEEYSFVWIVCALALLALSVGRALLDAVALALGIYYPPAALLLVLIFFVFVASLSFSVVISRQRQQIERLMEDVAILDAHVRELSGTREPVPGPRPEDDRPLSANHFNSAS
ncbi:N/A [soil metagenome]